MATIAEYTILPQDGFFGRAGSEFPGREIKIERVKPADDTLVSTSG
jgi:hypothetical protein